MSKEQEPQPPSSPNPTDYESWNEGFKAGALAGKELSDKLWRGKMYFRTFASAVGGIWFCGMAVMAFGPSVLSLLGGAALTTFFFYVLDQTEKLMLEGIEKLRNLRKKKEKKDGNDSSSGSDNS